MATETEFDPSIGQRPQISGQPGTTARTSLIIASLAAIAVWYIPILRLALAPITFVNTYIHEYCHALVGILTGGSIDRILINNNASGATYVGGGNPYLTATAGYVGSAIVGAILLRFSHNKKLVRPMLVLLAGAIMLGIVWKVRGETLGVTIGVISSVLIFVGARFLPLAGAIFLAQLLAILQCAASFQAFYWLFQVNSAGILANDAGRMGELTGLPPGLWAGIWSAFSAIVIFLSLRATWKDSSRVPPPRQPRTGIQY